MSAAVLLLLLGSGQSSDSAADALWIQEEQKRQAHGRVREITDCLMSVQTDRQADRQAG